MSEPAWWFLRGREGEKVREPEQASSAGLKAARKPECGHGRLDRGRTLPGPDSREGVVTMLRGLVFCWG